MHDASEKRDNVRITSLAQWLMYVRRECINDEQFAEFVVEWAMKLTAEESGQYYLDKKFH